MLTRLDIHNFRGLKEFSLKEAGRVNLIVGRNDSGKTSALEAIRLLLTGDPRSLHRTNRNRFEYKPLDLEQDYRLAFYEGRTTGGLDVQGAIGDQMLTAQATIAEVLGEETLPRELESEYDPSEAIESLLHPGYEVVVEITTKTGASATIRQSLRSDYSFAPSQRRLVSPEFPTVPPLVWLGTNRPETWAFAQRYSDLYRTGSAPLLLDILKEIEPRLKSLVILTKRTKSGASNAVLEVDIGLDTSLPLESMGDGFSSTIAILSAIGGAKDGLCLIDEVENGIHYSLLPQIWRSVASAASTYNLQ